MKRIRMGWPIGLVLSLIVLGAPTAWAQHDHSGHAGHGQKSSPSSAQPRTGPHGGRVLRVDSYFTEVVFQPKGVRVYLYNAQGQPVTTRELTASVMFMIAGNPKHYRYQLTPDTTDPAQANSFQLAVDLSRIPDGAMTAHFAINGLATATGEALAFQQEFHLAGNSEQEAIARQKTCPVSGQKLGSMGRPVKATVNGRDVYVCCAGCIGALKKNPEKYLARLPQAQKQTDPVPARATAADAAAVSRQRVCPVSDEPLTAMGGPWKVYAKGRPIFVCCGGCIRKVQQNPDYYLAKVARLTATSGQ